MSKKIAWVHPDTTFTLEMPEHLFEMISLAMDLGLVKSSFKETKNALRGNELNTVIIDELVEEVESAKLSAKNERPSKQAEPSTKTVTKKQAEK